MIRCLISLFRLPLTLSSLSVKFNTRIASSSLAEREVPVGLQASRHADRIVRRQEALLPEGVEVERAAVVLTLSRALRATLLDVGHRGNVGVGEGQISARLVHVLAVGGNVRTFVLDVIGVPAVGESEIIRRGSSGLFAQLAKSARGVVSDRSTFVERGFQTEISAFGQRTNVVQFFIRLANEFQLRDSGESPRFAANSPCKTTTKKHNID